MYPFGFFNSIDDYQKPAHNSREEDFFSKLKNKCPDDDKVERTREILKMFHIKNGEHLIRFHKKSDVILLVDVFENFIKVSSEESDIIAIFCVSLPSFTYQCGLRYTNNKAKTLQDKDMILSLKSNSRGGF